VESLTQLDPEPGPLRLVLSIVLPNIGTYVLAGHQKIRNLDQNYGAEVGCSLGAQVGSSEVGLGTAVVGSVGPNAQVDIPINEFYAVTTAPTTINVGCGYYELESQPLPTYVVADLGGNLTAIQVQ
jgi:hypothetical protein